MHQLNELKVIEEKRIWGDISPKRDNSHLGEILVKHGILQQKDLLTLLDIYKQEKQTQDKSKPKMAFGDFLVSKNIVVQEDIKKALCYQFGNVIVDLKLFAIPENVIDKLLYSVLIDKKVIPVAQINHKLYVACDNPLYFDGKDALEFACNMPVELVYSHLTDIINATNNISNIGQLNKRKSVKDLVSSKQLLNVEHKINHQEGKDFNTSTSAMSENDSKIITLVDSIILNAFKLGASDIHIENNPKTQTSKVRLRIDGKMTDYAEYPKEYSNAVTSRIKIISDLDISEKRKPQDGKISFKVNHNKFIDLRISIIPTINGYENTTIRILASNDSVGLDKIGLTTDDYNTINTVINKPYGLILVCGLTGSGKTTTIHSALKELNHPDKKIWTAENPIEITQEGLCQAQVNHKINWGFAEALRSFLRADPDVIMIGEIRDHETANIAIEASMTGHLVLSTLHTNNSAKAIPRLIGMGADAYNIVDSLLAIVSQRLVRKHCVFCKNSDDVMSDENINHLARDYLLEYIKEPSIKDISDLTTTWVKSYGKNGKIIDVKAKGCDKCNYTGLSGRLGLYEVLIPKDNVKSFIFKSNQIDAKELQNIAVSNGMKTLKMDGIEKVLKGITSIHQIKNVCH